jgi:hypothetical protein
MRHEGYEPTLYRLFHEYVHDAMTHELRDPRLDDVEVYLTGLLVDFSKTERLFALRDPEGRPVTSVYEMLAEGDVLLNAGSFEREREVHKHIGDYILFWSGVNPDYLGRLRLDDGRELVCDYTDQGRQSYHVVSTFDYSPYDREAVTFRKLSDLFEAAAAVLSHVGRQLPLGRVN